MDVGLVAKTLTWMKKNKVAYVLIQGCSLQISSSSEFSFIGPEITRSL